jgi:trimethylamine--corrinoid protein Co-methyltransferase
VDYGLKQGFGVGGVMPILGASTPLTLAGYLTMQTAEVLACNVMNWALLGRVSGYGAGPTILDMKQASPSQSSPEAVLLFLACMDLQRYYGETSPMFPYALSADSKSSDIQAGIEKTLSATVAALAGCRILSAGMGVLSLSGIASLAQLVIDYELCQVLDHMAKGFVVDDAHIGLEMIKQIGIGGNFLAESHTIKYMRETLFFPKVFDRQMASAWMENRQGMLERARVYARDLLRKSAPQDYLAPEQVRELDAIFAHAAQKLSG